MLDELLSQKKIEHVLTREAGNKNVAVCGQLREIALNPKYNLGPEAMECLFAAQRFENFKWYKSLDPKTMVVSDRGLLSHLCYGYASLPREQIDALFKTYCKQVNEEMKPHVIYLHIDPEEAARRMQSRGGETDNVELLGIEHQRKVADNFATLLRANTPLIHRAWVIDAAQDRENVKQQLSKVVREIESLLYAAKMDATRTIK